MLVWLKLIISKFNDYGDVSQFVDHFMIKDSLVTDEEIFSYHESCFRSEIISAVPYPQKERKKYLYIFFKMFLLNDNNIYIFYVECVIIFVIYHI